MRNQKLQVVRLLVLLFLHYLESAAQITSMQFTKLRINGGDPECATTTNNYQSFSLSVKVNTKKHCGALCGADDKCFLFDTKGNTCQLYDLRLPATVPCAVGNAGTVAYTKLIRDLALFQPVTYSSTVTDHISPFSDLTSNKTTYPDYRYCPCTNPASSNWVTVDLGHTYTVKRVDVTASFESREQYFKTINVHVGDLGNSNDPSVGGKDATLPGELQVLKFDVSAKGRYLTLLQQENTYFCLCKIQVYGF